MNQKTEPSGLISNLKVGELDRHGYKVVDVLALGNEYVIYEIEDDDINNRLRVIIDGHTDQSEQKIAARFVSVKHNYIKAKGMLYRSPNFGMMKNRVAHALASALTSDNTEDSNQEFEMLIKELQEEQKTAIKSRILYVLPAFVASILVTTLALLFVESKESQNDYWQMICILTGAIYGGSLSILSGIKATRFEELNNTSYYLSLGCERIFFPV